MKKRLGQRRAPYDRSESPKGYIIIRTESPKGKAMWVLEHRYVKSIEIGRSLESDEIVHHINGNKKDNSLENLKIISNKEHAAQHDNLASWYNKV